MEDLKMCAFCDETASMHGYDEWNTEPYLTRTDQYVYTAWVECDGCGATRGKSVVAFGCNRGDIHSPESNYSKAKVECEALAAKDWNNRPSKLTSEELAALEIVVNLAENDLTFRMSADNRKRHAEYKKAIEVVRGLREIKDAG